MQNWCRKITVVILTGFLMMFSQNATVMAAQTDCANCYYCTSWGTNGCTNCEYNEAYCEEDEEDTGDVCSHISNMWAHFNEFMGGNSANCGSSNCNLAIIACNGDTYCESWVYNVGQCYILAALCESSSAQGVADYLYNNVGIDSVSYCDLTGAEDIEDFSLQCETIVALSDNCARHIAIEDPTTTDTYLYLNCDGTGTPYSDYLAYAMCGDADVCFEQLANNWDMYTESLCFSSSALELGEYLGISSADCEASIGVVLASDNTCPECAAGEYYDSNAHNCYPCPELDGATAGTVLNGMLGPITMCYIPGASIMQDTAGTYQFTNDCPYTE